MISDDIVLVVVMVHQIWVARATKSELASDIYAGVWTVILVGILLTRFARSL